MIMALPTKQTNIVSNGFTGVFRLPDLQTSYTREKNTEFVSKRKVVLPDWDQMQKCYIFGYIVTKTRTVKATASHANSIELVALFAKHDAPFLSHSVNWCSCINDLISWGGKFKFRMGQFTLLHYSLHSLGKGFRHLVSTTSPQHTTWPKVHYHHGGVGSWSSDTIVGYFTHCYDYISRWNH